MTSLDVTYIYIGAAGNIIERVPYSEPEDGDETYPSFIGDDATSIKDLPEEDVMRLAADGIVQLATQVHEGKASPRLCGGAVKFVQIEPHSPVPINVLFNYLRNDPIGGQELVDELKQVIETSPAAMAHAVWPPSIN